jgi:hypothetical protein
MSWPLEKECYVCGNKYKTGRREWAHLSTEEKGRYLWFGLVLIPAITTALGGIGGYFLRWHEPYWLMAVLIGFLGPLSGLICSAVLLFIRWLPVVTSLLRTSNSERTLDKLIS